MYIPTGWFCVVKRHPRDTRSRGTIVKNGLKEETAKYLAFKLKEQDKDNNYWAIDGRKY